MPSRRPYGLALQQVAHASKTPLPMRSLSCNDFIARANVGKQKLSRVVSKISRFCFFAILIAVLISWISDADKS